ncbi:MAG: efflux RND transporter periplasmic adaptor subunit [Chitinophagales bacterium]|nr:efflux RND transporter periplasmic adaptor subunit [Chitinophagales bacterium]
MKRKILIIGLAVLVFASCKKPSSSASGNSNPVDISSVTAPTDQSVVASVSTTKPMVKTFSDTITAQGYIDYDTRTFNTITTLYGGRIDKLNVKYAYQEIHKGELLFQIYSPDIVNAEDNLIFILVNDADNATLINAAKQKLRTLGLNEKQIEKVVATKKADNALPVYSQYDGHIHEMNSSMMSTADGINKNLSDALLSLKEGMYVEKGQALFNVVNAHHVWAILKIYQNDIRKIQLHQSMEISMQDEPGMSWNAHVDFIEPAFSDGSKTLNVRVYTENMMHTFKVGSRVVAKIKTDSITGLWIPKSATVDLGNNWVVFLKNKTVFQSRKIQTGASAGDFIQIINGITSDDEIASKAQFLIDSESFIKTSNREN